MLKFLLEKLFCGQLWTERGSKVLLKENMSAPIYEITPAFADKILLAPGATTPFDKQHFPATNQAHYCW